MTSNSTDHGDSVFVTPDPTDLKSETTQDQVRETLQDQAVASDATPEGTGNFDPDEVARTASDAAASADEQTGSNLTGRQVGHTFQSGS